MGMCWDSSEGEPICPKCGGEHDHMLDAFRDMGLQNHGDSQEASCVWCNEKFRVELVVERWFRTSRQ